MSIRSRRIYTGRVISLDLTDVVLPNGHEVELEIVNHPGGGRYCCGECRAGGLPTQAVSTRGGRLVVGGPCRKTR